MPARVLDVGPVGQHRLRRVRALRRTSGRRDRALASLALILDLLRVGIRPLPSAPSRRLRRSRPRLPCRGHRGFRAYPRRRRLRRRGRRRRHRRGRRRVAGRAGSSARCGRRRPGPRSPGPAGRGPCRRACFDVGAQLVNRRLGRGGRGVPGQAFAHQKAHHLGQGRAGDLFHAAEARALDLGLQRRGQVLTHAAERIGADGLDARLLHRFEHAARHRVGRHEPRVRRLVVVGDAQSDLVGHAADARRLARVEVARRMRQDGGLAADPRAVAAEGDLQVRLFGERARRVGERALERFRGRFGFAGHGVQIAPASPAGKAD